MKVTANKPVTFDLLLRVPPHSGKVLVAAPGAKVERGERQIRVAKEWRTGDEVAVDFDFQTQRLTVDVWPGKNEKTQLRALPGAQE